MMLSCLNVFCALNNSDAPKTVRCCWLLCLVMFLSPSLQAAQLLRFEGRALDPDSQALLYIERHRVILNDQGGYVSAFVEYFDPKGRVIAEKTLNFSQSQAAPELMFHDKRHDERTTVSLKNNRTEPDYIRIVVEQAGKRKESRVDIDHQNVVIDGGFDRFIALNWAVLRQQKSLNFSFLAITRAQLINFKVLEEASDMGRISLELHPRNFFIDLLVKPIKLEYELETQRLLRFTGLSNIEQYEGGKRSYKNYVADIYYRYQDIEAYNLSENDILPDMSH